MRTFTRYLLIIAISSFVFAQLSCSSSNDGGTTTILEPIVAEVKPTINGTAQTVSAGTESSGQQSSAEILYNTAGDAMAVWKTNTGNGMQLKYSFKPANATQWPEAKSILSVSYVEHVSTRIEVPESNYFSSDGSQFVIVWSKSSEVFATHFNPAIAQEWSVATLINSGVDSTDFVSYRNLSIASNGSSFLATWTQRSTHYSNLYSNGTWQAAATKIVDIAQLYSLNGYRIGDQPILAPSSDRYALMGTINGVINNVDQGIAYAYEYDIAGASWSNIQILTNDAMPGVIRNLQLLATNRGFVGSWMQSDAPTDFNFRLYSKEFDATGSLPALAPAHLVTDTNSTLKFVDYSIAVNAEGYAFAWSENDVPNSVAAAIKINLYQASATPSWSGALTITAANARAFTPTILPLNNAYAVQWQENGQLLSKAISAANIAQTPVIVAESDNPVQSLFFVNHQSKLLAGWQVSDLNGMRSIYTRESVDGINWDAAVLLQQYSTLSGSRVSLSSSRWPLFTHSQQDNNLVLSWSAIVTNNNISTLKLFTHVYNNGWQASDSIPNDGVRASGQYPKMVTNEAGQTLAVWYQLDDGLYQLFASIRTNGSWSIPIRIDKKSVVHTRSLHEWDQYNFQLASNGRKFAVAWNDADSVFVQTHNGTVWQTEPSLLNDTVDYPHGPVIIAQQSSFQVFWMEIDRTSQTANIMSSVDVNSQWKSKLLFPLEQETNNINSNAKLVVSSGASNSYALAWLQANASNETNVYARVNKNGTWLTAPVKIHDTGYPGVRNLSLAGLSSGHYALAWNKTGDAGTGTYASIFAATSPNVWTTAELVFESGTNLALSANDDTYALIASTGNRLLARTTNPDTHLWGSFNELALGGTIIDSISLASSNNQFFVIWNSNLVTQGNVGTAKYSNGTWQAGELSLAPDSIESYLQTPVVSRYRDEFALSWGQVNLSSDASVTRIMSLIGGF